MNSDDQAQEVFNKLTRSPIEDVQKQITSFILAHIGGRNHGWSSRKSIIEYHGWTVSDYEKAIFTNYKCDD